MKMHCKRLGVRQPKRQRARGDHQPRREAVDPHDCPLNVQRRDLFQFIRWIMWFTAMYPLPFERLFPQRLRPLATLLDVSYELFMYFLLFHIDVLYMCTIYLNWGTGDLELLASCAVQTIIYTWALIIKLFFKRINSNRVDALMQYINGQYRTRSANGFTYVTMADSMALLDKWTKMFVGSTYVGVTFWLLVPLIYQDRSLPLPCWYPIDYKAPVVYEIIYFLQCVAQLEMGAAFDVTSAYFMIVCILFCGQYDILNCSLKNIIATAYIDMRAPQEQLLALKESQQIADAELNQYYSSVEQHIDMECIGHLKDRGMPRPANLQAAFKLALKSCIAHHRYILNGLDQIEKLYYFIWFFKTIEFTLLICLVMFMAVKSTAANSVLKVVSLAQYIILVLWDMLIIFYSGEMVFQNSQRCDEGLLRSPWYLHITEVKSDWLLFLLNAQRPFKLTAGKLYNLNLSRYRNILTTAFSFLTLLQKMDLRNQNSN